MAYDLLLHPDLLSSYAVICSDAEHQTTEEFSMNLLEHLLTIYLRVRSFSYAKDKVQQHKITNRASKKRSLRTEIKKSTSSLEQGH